MIPHAPKWVCPDSGTISPSTSEAEIKAEAKVASYLIAF